MAGGETVYLPVAKDKYGKRTPSAICRKQINSKAAFSVSASLWHSALGVAISESSGAAIASHGDGMEAYGGKKKKKQSKENE